MAKKTLTTYLNKYSKYQDIIRLVYRPTLDHNWGRGIEFMGKSYSSSVPYNHRSILEDEIVIEFDNEDRRKNYNNAVKVREKLEELKIPYSMWNSGNKSYHVHFFLSLPVSNKPQMKRAVTKYLTQELDELPDMQLTGGHLIRAEYGVNEKSGRKKRLVTETKDYPKKGFIPDGAFNIYMKDQERIQKIKMSKTVNDISNSDLVKRLLDTSYFSDKLGDGRERIIFALSNILIEKYGKEELTELLWQWYRYTNGTKLEKRDIRYKVNKANNKRYNITENYLINLLEDLN